MKKLFMVLWFCVIGVGVVLCSQLDNEPSFLPPITNGLSSVATFKIQRARNRTPDQCEEISSIDEFPADLFTNEQRQHGAIVLHIVGAVYFFTLLAVVCNDYFLPSVECICVDLNISKDVAAATFMATATTTPELFTNLISTFVADSDMGLGTIVGSLMFNTLGVAALAGMATVKPVQLERWPITRDCILFGINISFLVWFAWDAKITLEESIAMVVLYIIYFIILFNNGNIQKLYDRIRGNTIGAKRTSYDLPQPKDNHPTAYDGIYTVNLPDKVVQSSLPKNMQHQSSFESQRTFASDGSLMSAKCFEPDCLPKTRKTLWSLPEGSRVRKIWWTYTWPIKCVLTVFIPNPKTWRRMYPVTFVMCVLFIGMNAYLIVWMMTVMGYTFDMPESVMGLTFLAAGACMPEAISSVLMVRKGEGGIGVSNSLGANSLAILMSLGLPWLVRNIIHHNDPMKSYVALESTDLVYTILSLLLAIVVLYAVMWINNYMLKKRVGFMLIGAYFVFITLCVLSEMGVLVPGNACR